MRRQFHTLGLATRKSCCGLAQPQVSKHLRVLRDVGLVRVRGSGRQRLYQLNAERLKPIHDWVKNYERLWSERFDHLDTVLEELKANTARRAQR